MEKKNVSTQLQFVFTNHGKLKTQTVLKLCDTKRHEEVYKVIQSIILYKH